MSSTGNWLILTLAHWPLNADLLYELIDKSASTAFQLLDEEEATKDGRVASNDRRTNPTDSNSNLCSTTSSNDLNQPHAAGHIYLTGSSHISAPGRSRAEWETKWSEGERIFSRLMGKIGLEKFQRLPTGKIRLTGRLLDLHLSDFELNSSEVSNIVTQREKTLKELVWIATHVRKKFVLYSAKPIKKAVILCPFGEEEDKLGGGKNELAEIICHVLRREWNEKEGPLNGVEVEIKIVSELKSEP